MQKRILKYGIITGIIILVLYNSVYFTTIKKPSVGNANNNAINFWNNTMMKNADSSIPVSQFIKDWNSDAKKAIQMYSKNTGIGAAHYCLVNGVGKVSKIEEDFIQVSLNENSIRLQVSHYFGNALRDVTGKIKMDDFENTIAYNNMAKELNKHQYNTVSSLLKKNAKLNTSIEFVGCIEIKEDDKATPTTTILPIKYTISELKN